MRFGGIAALACSSLACAQGNIGDVQPTAGLASASVDGGADTDATATTGGTAETGDESGGTATTATPGETGDTSGPVGSETGMTSVETDDGESSTTDPPPFCGDGNPDPGEACDDGNPIDTDACLSTCAAASCGDGFLYAGVEVCDDGTNDGAYGGCNPGCAALAPNCGDAIVQPANEHCDGATGFASVGCTSCLYDFSAIGQLYCNGTCTWAGGDSCDQADADIYCKLVTADANSVATSFQIVMALDAPGFPCPSYGVNLGALPAFGVNVSVWYQDSSILANHGGGAVVAQVTCS